MTDIDPTTAQDAAEKRRVARLTDAQVLDATNRGQYGPALVGKHLAERSQRIMQATGGGMFGPAITDPDYDKKQRAARAAAEAGTDPAAEADDDDELEDADQRKAPPAPAPRGPAAVAPEGPVDPANLSDPRNPWTFVTLSGAKILAQEKQVSYAPRIKRAELIASLQAAGVVPPEIPTDTPDDDEPGA